MKIVSSIFTILLILTGLNSFAQRMSFTADVNPKIASVGESFEISYAIVNADGKNFRAPNLNIFEVLSGPNQSISTQSVNGSWSQSITYSYILRASKPGTYHVPPAQINIGGKLVQSNPLTIEIKNQAQTQTNTPNAKISAQDGAKDFFIKVVPNKQKAYIGEQVLVDFILYTRKSIQNIQPLSEVTCDKSFVQDIKSEALRETKDVNIGGQNYRSQLLKRIAVFPQEAGTITVHSFELQVEIINEGRNSPFQSMFRPFDISTKTYSTKELTFQALSIPDPVPSDFTGGVGNFSLNLGVSDIEATTDDAISVILTIEGDGDIKRILSPKLNFGNGFEVYEPKTKEETSQEMSGRIFSKKVLEYLLIPKVPGKYTINPSASYFDTNLSKYQSKSFKQIEITINKGSSTPKNKNDINKEDKANGTISILKNILVGLSAIIIFGTLGVLVYFRFRKKKEAKHTKLEVTKLEEKVVPKVERNPLEGLENFIEKGDNRAFYSSVNSLLKKWLFTKLDLSSTSMDTQAILNELRQKNFQPAIINQVKHIFDTCDMVLYAGIDKTASMPLIWEQLKDIIQGISNKA
ncbi:MAG TPA: BatD family protein [Saprospiraceae bacterium]|nr:BatD family protein [Saprospiraceae bacterium]